MSRADFAGWGRAASYFVGLLLAMCLTGCATGSLQSMSEEPRYDTFAGSGALPNGASAQPLVSGVVARGHLQDDTLLYTGLNSDGSPAQKFPYPITRAILARGQTEYNAFCIPCHDYAGTGHGMAVQAGYTRPPSLTADAARNAPVGALFATITNGHGAMPPYAAQVSVADRWAIVAYLRALQLSQHATLDDVPADALSQIGPAQAAP